MTVLSFAARMFLVVVLVPGVSWAAAKTCLTGTAPEVAADPAQIAAVRTQIDSTCACASFDGSAGKTHGSYVSCVNATIKSQVQTGNLRTQCQATVKKYYSTSTCGVLPSLGAVPCIRTSSTSGKVTCAIAPAAKCVGQRGVTSYTACPSATTCVDAADTNHDLMIAAPGDSGSCAATTATCTDGAAPFSSTFQAIQKVIFEKHSCTQSACHGSSAQGGLDLSPAAAYKKLIEVPSTNSEFNRVQPGDQNRSFLWLKLAAKTDPTQLPAGVQVNGAPMPNGLAAISTDELEALRLWIFSGAPETGTVGGTEGLLNACLPTPEPITIKPLAAPAAGTGVQLAMPPWKLEAHSEHEICFATYYDLTAQVPQQFQDPSGTLFRFAGQELRQDPQSHHLILNRYVGPASDVHNSAFGAWTCNGGAKAGQTCEPTDLSSCGSGTCTSAIKQSFACVGFGPQNGGSTYYAIGGAQKSQSTSDFLPGVFAQIPMKGILYWNSHAFNLTDQDTMMHAWLNFSFAADTRYPVQSIFDTSKIFAANAAPYSTQVLCNDSVLPQGARLFSLSSHTHKRGKHFSVTTPNGASIYDSFVYNDPLTAIFNPPLAFDSADPAQRTLHYCSLYNNGVDTGGQPDPSTVTRRSKTPQSALSLCTPLACAAGKVGTPCSGVNDNHTCDSASGANDGLCDACRISGGESTENEMFILIGQYYLANTGTAARAVDAQGRSTSTEVALPPQMGCASSHQGHGMHAAHAGQ